MPGDIFWSSWHEWTLKLHKPFSFLPEATKFSIAGASASARLWYQRGSQHGMMKTSKEHFENPPPHLPWWAPDWVRRESRTAIPSGCWATSVIHKDQVQPLHLEENATIFHIMFPFRQFFNISALSCRLLSGDAPLPLQSRMQQRGHHKGRIGTANLSCQVLTKLDCWSVTDVRMKHEARGGRTHEIYLWKDLEEEEKISARINRKDSGPEKTQTQRMIFSGCASTCGKMCHLQSKLILRLSSCIRRNAAHCVCPSKCHVWKPRRGSLPTQTVGVNLMKHFLSHSWPSLSIVFYSVPAIKSLKCYLGTVARTHKCLQTS